MGRRRSLADLHGTTGGVTTCSGDYSGVLIGDWTGAGWFDTGVPGRCPGVEQVVSSKVF